MTHVVASRSNSLQFNVHMFKCIKCSDGDYCIRRNSMPKPTNIEWIFGSISFEIPIICIAVHLKFLYLYIPCRLPMSRWTIWIAGKNADFRWTLAQAHVSNCLSSLSFSHRNRHFISCHRRIQVKFSYCVPWNVCSPVEVNGSDRMIAAIMFKSGHSLWFLSLFFGCHLWTFEIR